MKILLLILAVSLVAMGFLFGAGWEQQYRPEPEKVYFDRVIWKDTPEPETIYIQLPAPDPIIIEDYPKPKFFTSTKEYMEWYKSHNAGEFWAAATWMEPPFAVDMCVGTVMGMIEVARRDGYIIFTDATDKREGFFHVLALVPIGDKLYQSDPLIGNLKYKGFIEGFIKVEK